MKISNSTVDTFMAIKVIVFMDKEVRKYFGLGDNDRIDRDGILRLQKNAEEQLKVWSLTQFHREKLENEIEALEVLLGE